MSNISNTLRQRLAARPAPQAHPEADLLAAYLERSLPAAEREQITVHLAICAACREVVSLSLPPEPELSGVRQLNPRRRLWLLGLRGAALAACLTVVTFLAIKAPWVDRHSSATLGPSAKVGQTPGTTPEAANTAQPVMTNPVESAKKEVAASEPRVTPPRTTDRTSVPRRAVDASTPLSAGDTSTTATPSVIGAVPAAPLLPATHPAVGGPAPERFLASHVTTGAPATNLLDDLKTTESQPGPLPPPASSKFVNRAHLLVRPFTKLPSITVDILNGRTMGGAGGYTLGPPKSSPGSTSLTAHRSRTFPDKDAVPASAVAGLRDSEAFTASARTAPSLAMSYDAVSVQPTQWKVAGGKLWKSNASDWQDAYPQRDGAMEFSAVASRGKDVWAGGSHATLLHSRTGGMDWERVKLEDGASGSIVQISVEGLNVVVKTSDQQTWASQDGGKIWTSQPSN